MCDINAGQLILCFSVYDPAAHSLLTKIREHRVEHVTYRESIAQRLYAAHLKADPGLEFELHLVDVPEGQETWKSHYLQFFYKHELVNLFSKVASDTQAMESFSRSSNHFIAAPNHVLTLSQPVSPGDSAVSAQTFVFGPHYKTYKQFVHLPPADSGVADTVRIVVVDSGIAADAPERMQFPIVSQHNLLDPTSPNLATDEHGHGTAVALLVDDLTLNAEFVIIKVAGRDGRVAEWDALAAVAAKTDGHVLNLSMQFGLPRRPPCQVCGRLEDVPASRSLVFENIVEQVLNRPQQPVLIAAAGNASSPELAYPSRFGKVLAIGAITSTKQLSVDSNFGDLDASGTPHRNRFVTPGGNGHPEHLEEVLSSGNGVSWFGTSFATAFATAVVSTKISQQGLSRYQRDSLLENLTSNADKTLVNYSTTTKFGHGIMRA